MKVKIRINSLEDINPLSIIKSIMIGTGSGVVFSKKIFDYLKENPHEWYEIEIKDYESNKVNMSVNLVTIPSEPDFKHNHASL